MIDPERRGSPMSEKRGNCPGLEEVDSEPCIEGVIFRPSIFFFIPK